MRGRAALGLAASLLLHGGILLWAARLDAPPPRAVVELEVVRIEPRPGPGGDGEGGPEPGIPAAPAGGEGRPAGRETARPARRVASARTPAPSQASPRHEVSAEAEGADAEGAEVDGAKPVEAAGGETEPSDGEGIGGLGDGAGDGEGEGITGQGLAGGGRAGGGAGAGAGSGPGEDPHAALLAHLRAHAHRCYPPPARRRGIQGVVGLSFCIDEHGRPERMRIERSSGSALLDEAARSCVIEGAAPLPGPVGCVVLDLPFRLR